MNTATVPPVETTASALTPPPGILPNFDRPENPLRDVKYATTSVLLILVVFSGMIRLYTKAFIMKSYGLEDYTMFAATLGFGAYAGVNLSSLSDLAGVHQWNVSPEKLESFVKYQTVIGAVYFPLIAVTKVSICINYLKLFTALRDGRWWCIQVFIWVNTLYYFASFFLAVFECSPRAKIWNPKIKGTCVNYNAHVLATGSFNVLSDFLMLLFPLHCIWHLHLTKRRRLGVSTIFLIGLLACIASILRLVYSIINLRSHDSTFTLTQVALSISGEIAAGILVGNLVIFPRFFASLSPKISQLLSSLRSTKSRITKSSAQNVRDRGDSGPNSDSHLIQGDFVQLYDRSGSTETCDPPNDKSLCHPLSH